MLRHRKEVETLQASAAGASEPPPTLFPGRLQPVLARLLRKFENAAFFFPVLANSSSFFRIADTPR